MQFFAIAIDTTIRLDMLTVFGGGVVAFFKMFLMFRDHMRETSATLGKLDPPSGVLGDVAHLKITMLEHREWMVRAGLDPASLGDRRVEERRSGPQTIRP